MTEWVYFIQMEGSHSGLVRTLGKRVWGNPPGVRISYPPLEHRESGGEIYWEYILGDSKPA